ncbi:MAG: VOC family protein [Alphaproteobacteria bacterium]|nr:VOC family protein [Alphaproteobacteria bacterium]MCB9696024.1 VOC family protein [Alphaproteobacteria bacterium]
MTRLSHAFVFVKHLESMVRFYEEVFGLVPTPTADPGFVRMLPGPDAPAGAAGVALHRVPAAIADQIHLTTPPTVRSDSATKICFETDDLPALRVAIVTHGGLAPDPWTWEGTTHCECADPEGNVLQIFTATR